MKIRIVVLTDGKRWIAHGESGEDDSSSLQHMEVECDPQWSTNLKRDMICVVEAEIPYTPNRVQSFNGVRVEPAKRGRPRIGAQIRQKPWVAAGMSRRTWYRRQTERRT